MHNQINKSIMYYQLSRLGMCAVKQKGFRSKFGGSSKFLCRDMNIFDKKFVIKDNEPEKEEKKVQKINDEEKPKKIYGLRKTKIRNKILNFFNLNKSKKFCAFYSISFPIEITDAVGYQVFNTWLTRCRKDLGLKSYLWVAERQKNNTLHFHLITHNYMDIRKANDFMKASLFTQFEKGNLKCKLKSIQKYNGVDVDNLYHSKRKKNNNGRLSKIEAQRKLSYYLTKYISKNNVKSERLPWHCSRDISALFISINYEDVTELEIANLIYDNPEAVTTYEEEFFTMHYFKFQPDEVHFLDLTSANNLIFKTMNRNSRKERLKVAKAKDCASI